MNEEEKRKYDLDLSLDIFSLPLAPKGRNVIESPKIAELFGKETEMYNHREHIRRASKESVLVYLVIIFEEFLGKLLSALFMKRHETLKEFGKSILYKDVVGHTDMNELIKAISKEAAKDIVESSIEDLGDKLGRRFHLYLDQPSLRSSFIGAISSFIIMASLMPHISRRLRTQSSRSRVRKIVG